METFTIISMSGLPIDKDTFDRLSNDVIKGGEGSGFYGHAGRPGEVGGSSSEEGGSSYIHAFSSNSTFDISSYSSDVKQITPEQFKAQANYSDINGQMSKDLIEINKEELALKVISGDINNDSVKGVIANAKMVLNHYNSYLASESYGRARDYIDQVKDVLQKGDFTGIDAKDMNAMIVDSINKLVYQEIESNKQQFTDHGIRHLVGNIGRQQKIMGIMNANVTGREQLVAMMVMINHDVGYTVPLIREGGLRGVMTSGQHKNFSADIYSEQKELWNVGKIFSSDEFDKIIHAIRTHDSTDLDANDVLSTSTRLSDNLSLFNSEKLPSSFRFVDSGETILIKMGLAAKNKDEKLFSKHRNELYGAIDKANLDKNLKRDLKSSVKEMSMVTPKFTMGVLAGNISGISKNSKGGPHFEINHNEFDVFLQKYFDMGQRQAKKLFGDYGITKFDSTEYSLANGYVTFKVYNAKK